MTPSSPLILVVEDNPITLKMVRVGLESEGYRVVVALDGRSALARIESELPTLIIQDLLLPDMDGAELAERIRQAPGGTDIPIIAMSGLVSRLEEAQSLHGGFIDYLFKPVGIAQLLEVVSRHLPAPAGVSPRGTGQSILLVDDDPAQRKLQKLRLEHAGYLVDTAADGIEALEKASLAPPDAVVSDLLMPRMNGLELCLALRDTPQVADVPVILTSATFTDVEEPDLELARSVGATTIVARTPGLTEVLAALSECFAGGQVEAPRPTADPQSVQRVSLERFVRQLERQAAITTDLARRSAIAAAQVSIMSGAAEVLAARSDLGSTLDEVLRRALDAGGVSAGAIYLLADDGRMERRASLGFGPAQERALGAFLESLSLHARGDAARYVRVPATMPPTAGEVDVLREIAVESMLISPLLSAGVMQGVLVMASSRRTLGNEWTAAARAIGVQLAQAVAITRTLAQLRDSEERFRGLFEGAPLGLYRLSEDGAVIDANSALVRLLRYPSREALLDHRDARIFVDDDEVAQWRKSLADARDTGTFEMRARCTDGTVLWVENTARAVLDSQGGLAWFEGALVDVTERRRAQEERDAAQARLRQVLSASNAVIYVIRMQGDRAEPIWVSENMPRLMGYDREEALRDDWWATHLHPEDHDTAVRGMERLFASGHDVAEYRFRRKDGSYRWVLDERRILPSPEGVIEFVGAWVDITERKELEQQLVQAQKMEAIGNLAGGIAHDFNNLLTVITGLSGMLLSDLGEEHPIHADIQEIAGAAERAATLTRQLLAFSRRQVLSPRVIDLNSVIRNLGTMLRRLLREDITLVVDLASDAGSVFADSSQIEQVLINLVVNARDAMPGSGQLTIRTTGLHVSADQSEGEDIPPGDYVVFSVADTGIGMDDQTRLRIFEPFFTTKPQGKGTGLGLATVYGVVEQSGGWIQVRTGPGEGTTFSIGLPIVGTRSRPTEDVPGTAAPSGGETILVVEDDPMVRRTGRTILERLGYRVLSAAGPEEALERFGAFQESFDLLLTDLVMPGMSGIDLAGRMRAIYPRLRVLYTSGYPGDTISADERLFESAAFLPKPFSPGVLANKVRDVLDEAPPRSGGAEPRTPTTGEP